MPVDPENPTPEKDINPEQTAPLLFYVYYEFMTPLIARAWKTTSMPYEDLVSPPIHKLKRILMAFKHPLADYDRAEVLYRVSRTARVVNKLNSYQQYVPGLDPIRRKDSGLKQKHLFLSLCWGYRWELTVASEIIISILPISAEKPKA